MVVAQNYQLVKDRIARACARVGRNPEEITIVAVSKTVSPVAIREAFQAGMRHFGENRVQDAEEKLAGLLDIRPAFTFHMVGHLQSNKAALAVRLFDFIQSVDSVKLAEVLSKRVDRRLSVLIEVNVAGEASKSGLAPEEVPAALKKMASLPQLNIEGLMTVAPLVSDPEEVRSVFRRLRELRDAVGLRHLSMGMTDDFEVAVEEGATMVRIGRAIFGQTIQGK